MSEQALEWHFNKAPALNLGLLCHTWPTLVEFVGPCTTHNMQVCAVHRASQSCEGFDAAVCLVERLASGGLDIASNFRAYD